DTLLSFKPSNTRFGYNSGSDALLVMRKFPAFNSEVHHPLGCYSSCIFSHYLYNPTVFLGDYLNAQ
ncbi:hypothetical protein MO867_23395, partial [Microbulbifer sp. OS29]